MLTMRGQDLLQNDVVMENISRYLNLNDLESLKRSSELVSEDIVQNAINIKRERETTLHLGVDPMPTLTKHSRIVNIILLSGRCDEHLAWRQLIQIRHLELNLSVFDFTDEAINAFGRSSGIDIRILTVSSMALWRLQKPLKLDSIKNIVIDDLSDIYLPGLLRLLEATPPTGMTIPADYLDYPEIPEIMKDVTELKLTGPRKHTMGELRMLNILKNINLNLTHLEVTVTSVANAVLTSQLRFPEVKYLSVTAIKPILHKLAAIFPALETLELRNFQKLLYCNTDGLTSNIKTLRLVLGAMTVRMKTADRLNGLFPRLETVEVCGDSYDSHSLDAVFKRIAADQIIIGGKILGYELFYTTKWLSSISGICKELKIIPTLHGTEKLHWAWCLEHIKNMKKLESLHIRNFQQVTPLNIKKMLVEDSFLQQEFLWPGTTINCKLQNLIP